MAGPLAGIRVLDLPWVLAGPFASMILNDRGAEVIKVERPPLGDVARTTAPLIDGESAYFFSINRGKKSVCLELRSERGRALFLRLVAGADGWIVLAISWGVENQWELFCATIGRPELIDDPRFDLPHLRTQHHAELEPILNEALRQKTTTQWLAEFDAIGLPRGPLNNIPH